MAVGGNSFVFKKRQIPSCVGKIVCKCFEELSTYNGVFDLNYIPEYINNVKFQLEYFLYMVQIHIYKEEFLETPETVKVKGQIIKNVLYHADLTRIHLDNQIKLHGDCDIQLSRKNVKLTEFMKCFEYLFYSWDLTLKFFHIPESELPVSTLKAILESHYELIQMFEKYDQLLKKGYTSINSSFNGNFNMYHLFYQ